jgi:hypothetical protein
MQFCFAFAVITDLFSPLKLNLLRQLEVICQFAIGTFDSTETYCDEIRVIVTNYITSISGFWFDCVTSVPWSYMDLAVYRVLLKPAFNFGRTWRSIWI